MLINWKREICLPHQPPAAPHTLCLCRVFSLFWKSIEISVCQFACSNKETLQAPLLPPLSLPLPCLMAYICKANCSNSRLASEGHCHMPHATCKLCIWNAKIVFNKQFSAFATRCACVSQANWVVQCKSGRGGGVGRGSEACHLHMQSMGHGNVMCSSVWRDSRLKLLTPLW